MKKIILLIVIIIMCVIFIILALVSQPKSGPAQACQPYLNIDTIVKTGDLTSCNCLTKEEQKEQCQANISSASLYAEAVKKSDLSICEKITITDMKNACFNVVQGKIDFTNKAN